MKKCLFILIITSGFICLLTGCMNNSDAQKSNNMTSSQTINEKVIFNLKKNELPRFDGSTANIPLIKGLVAKILKTDVNSLDEYGDVSGTDASYSALLNDQTDIIFAYEISPETKKTLDFTKFDIAPIGSDALVFLVNRNNPIKNVTTKQIQDIYSGKTINWKNIGGEDKKIIAFQRNEASGSQTMMQKLVMNNIKMMDAPADQIQDQMVGLITSVKLYDNSSNAIGYSVFYYAAIMLKNPDIRFMNINGVTPTNTTIRSRKYPFVNDFYVVIRKDEAKDSIVRRIFEWIQSEDGQKLVSDSGYVSIK